MSDVTRWIWKQNIPVLDKLVLLALAEGKTSDERPDIYCITVGGLGDMMGMKTSHQRERMLGHIRELFYEEFFRDIRVVNTCVAGFCYPSHIEVSFNLALVKS